MNAHDIPAVAGAAPPRIGAYSRQSRSYINTFRPGRHDQRGAILVIALIMLLLLTIIGVSGLRGTTMEERMAGNFKEQYRVFLAAEYALRKVEQDIGDNLTTLKETDCGDSAVANPSTLTYYLDIDDNALNPDEETPVYHARYCGPNQRVSFDGVNPRCDPTADPDECHPDVGYYTVIGVGRVPDNAVAVLASTYVEPL